MRSRGGGQAPTGVPAKARISGISPLGGAPCPLREIRDRLAELRIASVPNPKFVRRFNLLRTNFGFEKDTSKLMILVWLWI
jgi:hypothetical protein